MQPMAARSRTINDEGLALVKRWEGLRLEAYLDSAAVWTIGYGHTGEVRPGQTITEAEAERLLRADLATAEAAVVRLVTVPLTDGQFGALVSFVFNVGQGAFAGSTLLRRLNAGEYDAVPGELARWNRAGGRVLQGLANRRAAEAGLWARGAFVSSNTVEPAPPPAPVGAAQAGVLAGVAAAAASAAPAVSALGGLPWQVGVAVVVAAAIAGATWLVRRDRAA